MQQDPLSLGLEIVKKAVADDIAQNFASAIRNYDLAVGYLTQALQDPKNAANQVLISIKIREYTERRAVLANALGPQQPQQPHLQQQHHSSMDILPPVAVSPPPPAAPPTPSSDKIQVTINDILRLAFDVAQHARREDAMGNRKSAFELYMQALESFLVVYKEESNPVLKDQLKSTILEYTTRAEQLKAELAAMEHPPVPVVVPVVAAAPNASRTSQARLVGSGIRNEDVDGPFSQTVRKAHPGYSGAVDMTVRVPRKKYVLEEGIPIHLDVDNQCGRQVESIKAYLLCTTDSYYWKSPDAQERKSETQKTLPREFMFGKAFPLVHGLRFEGDFVYELGPRLKPTERNDPSVLVREYVLVVKCFFKRPWRDLKAFIPIAVFERK